MSFMDLCVYRSVIVKANENVSAYVTLPFPASSSRFLGVTTYVVPFQRLKVVAGVLDISL